MDMREALLIEDEKEGIRRRIIAEEIDRVRILNAELRREPVMPRVGRLPPSSNGAFLMGFEPRFPPLEQQPQHRSVQERMAIPFGERLGMMGISSAGMPASCEFGYVEMVPFNEPRVELSISEVPFEQRSVTTPMISEIPSKNHGVQSRILELKPKPPSNPEQLTKELKISGVGATTEQDKLLAKPNVNLSGVKRRQETAAEAVISSDLPTIGVPKKKIKDGCYCALCQVSVTSECNLKSHLKGRKHKSMEVALKAQGNGKGLRTRGFPEEHKPLNPDATPDDPMAEKKLKTGETVSIPEAKDAPLLQIEHKNNVDSVNDKEEAGKGLANAV